MWPYDINPYNFIAQAATPYQPSAPAQMPTMTPASYGASNPFAEALYARLMQNNAVPGLLQADMANPHLAQDAGLLSTPIAMPQWTAVEMPVTQKLVSEASGKNGGGKKDPTVTFQPGVTPDPLGPYQYYRLGDSIWNNALQQVAPSTTGKGGNSAAASVTTG